ncbi:MAG: hypothetical protein AB4042_08800 [Leptolyngbyaceae cyanobacterium]
MDNLEVLVKRDAAVQWCHHASDYMQQHGDKPWYYGLIPHNAIAENMTLKGLVNAWSIVMNNGPFAT